MQNGEVQFLWLQIGFHIYIRAYKSLDILMFVSKKMPNTGLPLVREKSGKFKVWEKSRNFEKKVREINNFEKKSGKFAIGQGNFEVLEDVLFTDMTRC